MLWITATALCELQDQRITYPCGTVKQLRAPVSVHAGAFRCNCSVNTAGSMTTSQEVIRVDGVSEEKHFKRTCPLCI